MDIKYTLILIFAQYFGARVSGQNSAELVILNATLPIPMTYTASAYDGEDSIYVIGGSISESVHSRSIYKFSISSETVVLLNGQLPENAYTGDAFWDENGKFIYYFNGASAWGYKINPRGANNSFLYEIIQVNARLMFTTASWNTVTQKAYVFGHLLGATEPGRDFFEYDALTGGSAVELRGVFNLSMSGVASFCDEVTGHVYFLGGRIWKESRPTDTIYKYTPNDQTLQELNTRLPYLADDGRDVWDRKNGVAYVFDTGNYNHAGLMKYNPRTDVMSYIPIPLLQEFVIQRMGVAFVEKLNRIYMLGGINEEWWNHGSSRIQYIQLY